LCEVNRENEEYVDGLPPESRENYDMKTAQRSFENVGKFKHFGTTVRN
jgi:hypothetical protein